MSQNWSNLKSHFRHQIQGWYNLSKAVPNNMQTTYKTGQPQKSQLSYDFIFTHVYNPQNLPIPKNGKL